jgi:hypothetical protein
VEHTWIARKVRPWVAGGVAAVFLAFMALSWFVFGSGTAVRSLAAAGVAALVAMVPGLLARVEYRLTDSGVERRPVRPRDPQPFEPLFSWDELSHVVPTATGFSFYRALDARGVARLWKYHVLSGYSGEVHVEPEDMGRIRGLVERRAPRLPDTR